MGFINDTRRGPSEVELEKSMKQTSEVLFLKNAKPIRRSELTAYSGLKIKRMKAVSPCEEFFVF